MILGYHEVTDSSKYTYSVSRRRFEEHIQLIAAMHRAHEHLPPKIQVTFDDGHKSNYLHAADILDRYGVRATFFVIAGWIGVREHFMTWGDLRELAARGHKVQSHGWSHRFLTDCTATELRDELHRSRKTIEDALAAPVDSISVPYGRWDQRIVEACHEADYRCIYTSEPVSSVRPCSGMPVFGRYMVRRTMTPEQLRRLADGNNIYSVLYGAQHHLKEGVKRLLGDHLYHKVWCRLAG